MQLFIVYAYLRILWRIVLVYFMLLKIMAEYKIHIQHLLYMFKLRKSVVESCQYITEAYENDTIGASRCQVWFTMFLKKKLSFFFSRTKNTLENFRNETGTKNRFEKKKKLRKIESVPEK